MRKKKSMRKKNKKTCNIYTLKKRLLTILKKSLTKAENTEDPAGK